MNEILVDSSVLLDLFTKDPSFYQSSLECLAEWGASYDLCINDIIYAEISIGFSTIETLDDALAGSGFKMLTIPKEALFLAGKAFYAYRSRGGLKKSTLPDFFIGAHAAVSDLLLITRDPKRVKDAYPSVKIIIPGKSV